MTDTSAPSLTRSLRRLLPFLKPIMPRLILGLISALAASIVTLMIPQVYQALINSALQPGGESSGIWIAAGLVLLLGAFEALFVSLRRFLVIAPATTVETTMRTSLYRQLQQLSVTFHDRWGSGQLLSRAMSDLNLIRRWMAFGAILLVVTTLTVIIGTAMMFTLSWVLALIFIAATVPLIITGFRFNRYYREVSRKSLDQAGDLATTVEESVQGIRVLKAFGRSREALAHFSGQAEELRTIEINKAKSLATFSMVVTLLPELALGTALITGILLVTSGQLTVGALVAFFATAAIIAGPVEFIGPLMAMTLSAKTAVNRHFEVMDAPLEITDPQYPARLGPVRGALEICGVSFRYPDAAEDVLRGVNLSLSPGETMALVGVTGSGKSTLLQLIPRLYEVSEGTVRIDGVDVRQLPLSVLRSVVSMAFEESILFSSSVRQNVLLSIEPQRQEQSSEAELQAILDEALDVAQSHFAYALPEGVDTVIGEKGLSLSGGQRQRLALARAIAAKPSVLVLDDPLSALDVATEELVEARLRTVLAKTTTLIVAHRPSTVALADRVALLQDGRISAVGTHAKLLASNAHYRYVLASLSEEPRGLDSTVEEDQEGSSR